MIIFLREKFIAQLFMWIIAIVFLVGTVFLYSNTRGGNEDPEGEVVLRINNTEVKRREFENAVATAMERQRQNQRSGPADREETEKAVIDLLVEQSILGSIDIGDAEVEHYIRSDADRVQQYNLYQQFGAADVYMENTRYYLSGTALRDSIQSMQLVTDAEIEQIYRIEMDQARVNFIEFKHANYASIVEVDEAEAQTYYEENQDRYRTEEQINVKFIRVDPANFVSDDDVTRYYEQNPSQFMTLEAVKARHILKKFPNDMTEEQKAEIKTAAEELLKTVTQELEAGAEFSELAKKYSEGPSSEQGGALRGRNPELPPGDYFARGDMAKPFEDTAFDTLQPGEVSGLVETRFGYHIIKLEEKKVPELRSFPEVQYEIRQRLVQVNGVDEAKEIASDLLYEIEIQDYDAALEAYKELNLTAMETGLFTRNVTDIPNIGPKWSYQGLTEDLFDTEVSVVKVVEAKKSNAEEVIAYFVATVLEKKPPTVPPFTDMKALVLDDLKTEKAKARAFTDAQTLLNQRGDATSLEDLIKKYQAPEGVSAEPSLGDTSLFTLDPRINYVPGMGESNETMFAAFQLDLNDIAGPFKAADAAYIVQLAERLESDIETFKTDPAEVARQRRTLIQTKKLETYTNWLAAHKKASELWIHPDYR